MASLVEIPRSKWIGLRDLYKSEWPKGVVAYCVLDLHIANPALSDIVNFKVYSPEGDINNGMIATVDLFGYYQLLIHPLNNIRKTEEALQNTNVIDWSRDVCIPSANFQVIEYARQLQERLGLNMNCNPKSYKHVLDDNIPEYDISDCPPDSYVASLKPEHIPLIDTTWTFHDKRTNKFFEMLMNFDMTYVLYSSIDDKPMAWITVNAEGALTHLYTLEPYRRLGYGEFITKYAVNDLRRKGRTVLAYTVESNEKARRMLEKLGLRVIGRDQWIFSRP